MTIEMKSFAISTLDDIAEGFFHARISDLPESKPCWQEIRKMRLSAAERSGRQQAANAAKQSPAEKAGKEAGCGRYKRAWGTTFEADAPLVIPDHPTKGPAA